MSDDFNRYRSPLETRYASDAMQGLWSDAHRFGIWRRLWLALAESQKELGLDITDQQLKAIRDNLDNIDFAVAAEHELIEKFPCDAPTVPSAAGGDDFIQVVHAISLELDATRAPQQGKSAAGVCRPGSRYCRTRGDR